MLLIERNRTQLFHAKEYVTLLVNVINNINVNNLRFQKHSKQYIFI